jgi:hypothetical protein
MLAVMAEMQGITSPVGTPLLASKYNMQLHHHQRCNKRGYWAGNLLGLSIHVLLLKCYHCGSSPDAVRCRGDDELLLIVEATQQTVLAIVQALLIFSLLIVGAVAIVVAIRLR